MPLFYISVVVVVVVMIIIMVIQVLWWITMRCVKAVSEDGPSKEKNENYSTGSSSYSLTIPSFLCLPGGL